MFFHYQANRNLLCAFFSALVFDHAPKFVLSLLQCVDFVLHNRFALFHLLCTHAFLLTSPHTPHMLILWHALTHA